MIAPLIWFLFVLSMFFCTKPQCNTVIKNLVLLFAFLIALLVCLSSCTNMCLFEQKYTVKLWNITIKICHVAKYIDATKSLFNLGFSEKRRLWKLEHAAFAIPMSCRQYDCWPGTAIVFANIYGAVCFQTVVLSVTLFPCVSLPTFPFPAHNVFLCWSLHTKDLTPFAPIVRTEYYSLSEGIKLKVLISMLLLWTVVEANVFLKWIVLNGYYPDLLDSIGISSSHLALETRPMNAEK